MVSREVFEPASARAAERHRKGAMATSAHYDRKAGRIVVSLDSGVEITFAPANAEGLDRATASELAEIEITPSGLGLHFPRLDADVYVPALVEGVLGSRRWMATRLGEAGGRVRSAAKAAASRGNGRLGGRPRKGGVVSATKEANPPKGDSDRVGAVRGRSQVAKPKVRDWTKRDAKTGQFMDRKADDKPSKGVRKEK